MAIIHIATDNEGWENGMEFYGGAAKSRDATYTASEARVRLSSNVEGATPHFDLTETNTLWWHFRTHLPDDSSGGAADGALIDFTGPDGTVARIDVHNGNWRVATGTTNFGSSWSFDEETAYTIDIYLLCDGTNTTITLYVNGSEVSSATTTSTNEGIDQILFSNFDTLGVSASGDDYMYLSEILMDDADSTIGCRVQGMVLDGDGFHTEWTGTYTGLITKNDGNFIESDSAGERYSGTLEAYAGPNTGETIRGILAEIEIFPSTTGPGGVTQFLRIDGTDYYGTEQTFTDTRHQKAVDFFVTNPDTELAWTIADLNALEIGVRSET